MSNNLAKETDPSYKIDFSRSTIFPYAVFSKRKTRGLFIDYFTWEEMRRYETIEEAKEALENFSKVSLPIYSNN
jgi:hypothetical protein